MSTNAKEAKLLVDLEKLAKYRANPAESKLRPRDLIRMRLRCRICGRSRAVYRKFGVCRICLRNLASNGEIPGMRKASW